MKNMVKVLNLYAGIGGNRKLWENVKVTAVEIESDIADIYRHFFPEDRVIVCDAHEYLLKHFKEYDFIWSSPPCPTHSRARYLSCLANDEMPRKQKPVYPDMKLYQEILFLKGYCKVPFVVENVIPFYKPLIEPQTIAKWSFWANFKIHPISVSNRYHFNTNSEL